MGGVPQPAGDDPAAGDGRACGDLEPRPLRWTGTTLDTFNATTPILILAVAAGHAVQILKRYYECYVALRSDGALDPREANRRAVVEAVPGFGPTMLPAGSIAATSFCSLLVFEVRTIQVFGVFTALGIASAVVIELTFTPANTF